MRFPLILSVVFGLFSVSMLDAEKRPGSETSAQVEAWGDFGGAALERQLWFRVNHGLWMLQNQNYQTDDGKSSFSFIGFGRGFKPTKVFSFSLVGGPQITHQSGVDRFVLFARENIKTDDIEIALVSRLSFGSFDSGSFF